MRRVQFLAVLVAAELVVAGGYVHLREWGETYRHVPASIPGAFVVRIGFPLSAGLAVALAGLFVLTTLFSPGRSLPVIAMVVVFEVASATTLIASHTATVLGWMEHDWTRGAKQTLTLEIGAVVVLALVASAHVLASRGQQDPARLATQVNR